MGRRRALAMVYSNVYKAVNADLPPLPPPTSSSRTRSAAVMTAAYNKAVEDKNALRSNLFAMAMTSSTDPNVDDRFSFPKILFGWI